LSFDGAQPAHPPLRTDRPASSFDQRIESYVLQQLEESLGGGTPKLPAKLALSGTAIAAVTLVVVALAVVVIILLVRVAL